MLPKRRFTETPYKRLPRFPRSRHVALLYVVSFQLSVFWMQIWGETKEKRSFEDRHESTKAYIDYMRPRCLELHRVLKKTGSFYYHCDCTPAITSSIR